jgi:hypothetical protein
MRMAVALTVVIVSVTAAASGQGPRNSSPPSPGGGPSVTVRYSDVSLSRALRDLGQRVGLEIVLAPTVADARLSESLYVNAAFEDVFVNVIHGQCLAYRITGPRSIVVTRSQSGGKSNASGPRVVTWPDCADGYVAPARPELTPEGLHVP